MIRVLCASISLFCLLLFASLALAIPHRGFPSLGEKLPLDLVGKLAKQPGQESGGQRQKGDFVITQETEVQLDGKPCQYTDIPKHAVVVLLEIAPDGRTVVKVHFRTKK